MKFHCEYCKELIDSEKDKKCPSCGASYKNNKEYEKLLEEKKEQQKEIQDHFKRINKLSIIPFVLAIIIIIGVFALIIVGAIRSQKTNEDDFNDLKNRVEENINWNNDNEEEEEKEVEVEPIIVNQEKTSEDYKVKVEKYKLLEQKDNNEHDKLEVTVIVEKISNKFNAWGEEIYCLVDNVTQKEDAFDSDISTYIKDKNIPLSKKMTYYVPKNLKSFDIKYGNILSFHIELQND